MGMDISVKEFKRILQEEVEEVAKSHGWDYTVNTGRGYAFQLWVANLLSLEDRGFDTDPEESLLYGNDLKADIVLEDSNRQYMLIAQCKFQSLSKMPPVDETHVNDFFGRHPHFSDSDWVRKHGSSEAIDFLGDYADKLKDGYSIDYYFASTGEATDRTKELADRCTKEHQSAGNRIHCHLLDFYGIKELYLRTRSLEETIPAEVRLQLPAGRWIEKETPYPTVITVVKGNALRNLYRQHKEALFAWNIRGYLGSRGVNTQIIGTAKDRGSDFFYFNNGVSAICTHYEFQDNELHALNFQIINGAQTVGGLAKAPANPDVDVLFRLTKTSSVKTEKGMNIDIIRYNNSQNIIKTSDFHANDPIQLWLEKQFKTQTPCGPVCKINYLRRRGPIRRGQGQPLKLEELAKARYAFLIEPTLCHSSPKSLWTSSAENGAYEKAFGVDGESSEVWSKEEFRRCLVALAFYMKIEQEIASDGEANPQLKLMKRLRFHALSLAGLYVRKAEKVEDVDKLLASEEKFRGIFRVFWSDVRRNLIDCLVTMEEQRVTMHTYVRSIDRWEGMVKRYQMHVTQPSKFM